jgi:ABC-type nitrate/sulfonate/bicarbonate transport system substrate-binding protein
MPVLPKAFDLLRLCVLSLLALSALAIPAQAQGKKEITLNVFRSSSLWPIWAAQKQGYFDKHGLAVKIVYTQNSTSQMVGLIKGEFDMVNTALDNVIAYSEGEGAAEAPKEADLVAFIGGNNGTLTLIAQPEIKSVAELKGKDLAVDSPSTGFSFVLREILAQNGLKDGDYKLVQFGNTGARWKALQGKQAVAALLTPPVSQIAVAQGFSNIATAADALGGYQGIVSAARRDWIKNNPDSVVAFIRAYREGQEWLLTPDNKQQALELLIEQIPDTPRALAENTYELLVANPRGFDPGGKIDAAGAKRVLDLRRRYGPQGKTVMDIGRFVDESYFERAAKN